MAENEDGQEKSEEPTSKRISDAREKGQVARSKELGTFLLLIVSAAMFLIAGGEIINGLLAMMSNTFTLPREHIYDTSQMTIYFTTAIIDSLRTVTPLLSVLVVAAIVSGIMLSGWNFSMQALQPKLDKLDPIKGLGRLFAWRGLLELAKSLAKFLLIAVAAYFILRAQIDSFLGLGSEPLIRGLDHVADLLMWAFLLVSSTMIILVAIDVPFQLWDHNRQLKMTKQEVRDESKNTEGNPEIKGRQRRMQMELSQGRMMESVPDADVVITNPTHYAIALKYDGDSMAAPIVVAKGSDYIAATIRTVARDNGVPIVTAPPLARAIYYSTEIEKPIPDGLYRAVAQVLAYVFHLKEEGDKFTEDKKLDDLPIPAKLQRDK